MIFCSKKKKLCWASTHYSNWGDEVFFSGFFLVSKKSTCTTIGKRSEIGMISFMETSWRRVQQLEDMLDFVPGSINSLYWGLTHPTFNDGNPYNQYI